MSAPAWRSPADLRGGTAPSIAAGELIRTGGIFHPHYQVIALGEDKAWVRDLQGGTDHIIPIDRRRPLPNVRQEPICN